MELLQANIERQYDIQFTGQIYQDLIAYLLFKGKPDGFFIDIGANDGISISNTYVLENLGWKGICIEPQPDVFIELEKNRRCDCYNVALFSQASDSMEFLQVKQDPGYKNAINGGSGIKGVMPYNLKKKLKNYGEIKTIKVKTMAFAEIMKNYPGINYIDFMSIDTEGAEMNILKMIDFSKYHFGLIAIENNTPRDTMQKYMRQRGYEVFMVVRDNLILRPRIPLTINNHGTVQE
jgi:FkbM family methyltransferase